MDAPLPRKTPVAHCTPKTCDRLTSIHGLQGPAIPVASLLYPPNAPCFPLRPALICPSSKARNKYVAVCRCRSYYGLHEHEDMASEPVRHSVRHSVPANPGRPPVFATGSCPDPPGLPLGSSRVTHASAYREPPAGITLTGGSHFGSTALEVSTGRSSTGRAAASKPASCAGSNPAALASLSAGLNFEISIA